MIAGLVLAAGASSRMGAPKLSLKLGRETLLARSIEVLKRAGLKTILVVVRPEPGAAQEFPGVTAVENPVPERGLASSLRLGLEALPPETEAVMVALADKPLVKSETVDALLRAYREGDYGIVYPSFEGEQGHPVIWDHSLFEELKALTGDRGGRSLIALNRDRAFALTVGDPGVCLDIDTSEDYARARELVQDPPSQG